MRSSQGEIGQFGWGRRRKRPGDLAAAGDLNFHDAPNSAYGLVNHNSLADIGPASDFLMNSEVDYLFRCQIRNPESDATCDQRRKPRSLDSE